MQAAKGARKKRIFFPRFRFTPMSPMRSTLAAGFSLLELVITLAIGSWLTLLLSSVLFDELRQFGALRERQRGALVREQLGLQLLRIGRNYDAHRIPVPPTVHSRGRIRFADGTLHPITQSSGLLAPHPRSDALTFALLDTAREMGVVNFTGGADAGTFTLCPLRASERLRSTTKNFLGVSSDGLLELTGSVQLRANDCAALQAARPTHSMLPNSLPALTLPLIRMVFPIETLATLYIDRRDTLRYLAHRGEQTIENQPMAVGIQRLQWRLTDVAPAGWLALRATITPHLGGATPLQITNRLGRIPPWMNVVNAR